MIHVFFGFSSILTFEKNVANVAHFDELFIIGTLSLTSATSIIVHTFRALNLE